MPFVIHAVNQFVFQNKNFITYYQICSLNSVNFDKHETIHKIYLYIPKKERYNKVQ